MESFRIIIVVHFGLFCCWTAGHNMHFLWILFMRKTVTHYFSVVTLCSDFLIFFFNYFILHANENKNELLKYG